MLSMHKTNQEERQKNYEDIIEQFREVQIHIKTCNDERFKMNEKIAVLEDRNKRYQFCTKGQECPNRLP